MMLFDKGMAIKNMAKIVQAGTLCCTALGTICSVAVDAKISLWDPELVLDDAVREPLVEQTRQREQRIDELFRWLLDRRAISRREAIVFAPQFANQSNVSGLAGKAEPGDEIGRASCRERVSPRV